MAGDIWISSSFRSIIWTGLFSMSKVWVAGGYYCRRDWCNYNEYCCGDDICCDYLTGYWYLWLLSGLFLFSLILVCCWMRYHRYYSKKSVEASSKGYIPVSGTVVQYGEQYYVPQQPPQVPFAREPPVYTEERQFQSQEYEESRYYPPPYDYIERKSPSAPPEGQ